MESLYNIFSKGRAKKIMVTERQKKVEWKDEDQRIKELVGKLSQTLLHQM